MDRLTAMKVFVETVERGSLTAAAEALDMSRAMASRHLESLEQWLGARLLHRTTRRIGLSEAGEQALSRCREMLELADDVHALSGQSGREAAGKLRLTTSPSFAQSHLTAAVVDFQLQYPKVQIELVVVDRAVNLAQERIDLAVRISNRIDAGLVARRLATCRSVLCASPAYVERHGLPERPEELKSHRCVTHSGGVLSEYKLRRDGRTTKVAVHGTLTSNETAVVRAAALAGAGIAMLPTYYVGDDLAAGKLVRVLPRHEPEPLDIAAVYLSRRHQPQPLRLLIEFLANRFGGDLPPWDRGSDMARPSRRTSRKGSRRG
jgi:DNA-binding transcriptional LysR family regulator